MNLRLLIYAHSWAPTVGGVEATTRTLAEGLAEFSSTRAGDSIEVTVVTLTPADGMNDSALSFRVVRRPRLWKLIKLFNSADIVHLAGPVLVPLALGWLLKKCIVLEHHGFQSICPNGQLFYELNQSQCPGHFMAKRYQKCLECNSKVGKLRSLAILLLTFPRRWLCQRMVVNIFPTEWLGTVLQLNRGVRIYHGIPDIEGPLVNIEPPVYTFTFLGRLVSTKGAQVLLNAARVLKSDGFSFRINIVGQGPDRKALEKLSSDYDLEGYVDFLGYMSPTQLKEILVNTSAVVVPSLAGEVFGLVVLENMLRSKCLIASDIPSFRELIGDTGLLFQAGDSLALAARMRQILEMPSLSVSLGLAARGRAAELFSLERMLQTHISVYRELWQRTQSQRGIP